MTIEKQSRKQNGKLRSGHGQRMALCILVVLWENKTLKQRLKLIAAFYGLFLLLHLLLFLLSQYSMGVRRSMYSECWKQTASENEETGNSCIFWALNHVVTRVSPCPLECLQLPLCIHNSPFETFQIPKVKSLNEYTVIDSYYT